MNTRAMFLAMSLVSFPFSLAHSASMGKMEVNIDRPGADYTNFDLPAANPNICENECAADSACVAWSYVRPGFQGPNARCWLKNDVPEAVANGAVISSVKVR
jgi:hypothetical protein